VKTGSWSGTLWLIDSGLVAGDRVVVDGVQKVAPGRVVKPVPVADSAARLALPTKPSNGDAR
jgi:membrane fusion protein (multidrug efflux system)